jgi:uncharacterized Fe-S cluster-containing radical SAM superfamily protein
MKKILLDTLSFEVTRRCNQQCRICMRGYAQNIDMSQNIVDDLFYNDGYQITDIYKLFFSGGEPLLNPDIIDYIIDTIIKNNIYVEHCSLFTNGLIFEPRVVEAFNRLNSKMGKIVYGGFAYEPDQYHKPMPENVKELYSKTRILEKYEFYEREEYNTYRIGLARENGIGSKDAPDEDVYKRPLLYQEIEDDTLLFYPGQKRERHQCFNINRRNGQTIYLNALGYLLSVGDGEYIEMDKYNLGNIKDKSLIDMSANVKTLKMN